MTSLGHKFGTTVCPDVFIQVALPPSVHNQAGTESPLLCLFQNICTRAIPSVRMNRVKLVCLSFVPFAAQLNYWYVRVSMHMLICSTAVALCACVNRYNRLLLSCLSPSDMSGLVCVKLDEDIKFAQECPATNSNEATKRLTTVLPTKFLRHAWSRVPTLCRTFSF